MLKFAISIIGFFYISGIGVSAEFVVISNTSDKGNPTTGTKIDTQDHIGLGKNQTITLLRKDGKVFRISGPYDGSLVKNPAITGQFETIGNEESLSSISSFLSDDSRLIQTLGTSRLIEIDDTDEPKFGPWYPQLIGTGTFCIRADDPMVWRMNTENAVRLTLISPESDFADYLWREGENNLRLDNPNLTPATDYTLLLSDREGESRLRTSPQEVRNLANEIAWMADVSCDRQAAQLLINLVR